MKMKIIVYEEDFGQEMYGKIADINGKYQCYITPIFGGDFIKVGNLFDNLEDAKNFLNNLT